MKTTEDFLQEVCTFLNLDFEKAKIALNQLRDKQWRSWGGAATEQSVTELTYLISYLKQPKLTLELGTNYGWTSLHLFAALLDSQAWINNDELVSFLTTDIDEDAQGYAKNHFWMHDLEATDECDLQFFLMDSVRFANLITMDRKIDLVFIDSSHQYEHTKQEWNALLQGLKDTSVVLFHDATTPVYGVAKFLDELAAEGQWKVLKLPTQENTGFGIVKKA